MNDRKWLYQHSPRCSVALQLFLDYNPEYWCLVPMKTMEVNMVNTNRIPPSVSSSVIETSWAHTDEDVRLIIERLPEPPLGFDFSISQRQEQQHFFKLLHDCVVPRDNVDLYNADIVAIYKSIPMKYVI